MSTPEKPSIVLLERPEPHFPEGRQWASASWKSWLLWLMTAGMIVASAMAAFHVEMTVEFPLSGSIAKQPGGSNVHVVLFADDETAVHLDYGQPVRLRVNDVVGWGVVIEIVKRIGTSENELTKTIAAILSPSQEFNVVPGQACEGYVSVGVTPVIRCLWLLVTNRRLQPTRTEAAQLRQRIPPELRDAYLRATQQVPEN